MTKRLLFICSQNRLRSPTAEEIFSEYPGIETCSAGTNHDAENPISADLIAWADIILVMEKTHKSKITKRFRSFLANKRIIILGIPDNYDYQQPELIALLKKKFSRLNF